MSRHGERHTLLISTCARTSARLPAAAPLLLLVLLVPLCRRSLPATLVAVLTIAIAGAGVALAFTAGGGDTSDESDEAAMYGY